MTNVERKQAIREFIDKMLVEAKDWFREHPEESEGLDLDGSRSFEMAFLWALVVGIVCYVTLYYAKPRFIMVESNNVDLADSALEFNTSRAMMFSVVVAVLAFVAFHSSM